MVIGNGGATYIDCKNESFDFSMEDEGMLQLKLEDITNCILNSDKEIKINNFLLFYDNDRYFIPSMTLNFCEVSGTEHLYLGLGVCVGNLHNPAGTIQAPVCIRINIRTGETVSGKQIPIFSSFYIININTNEELVSFDSSI